MLTAASDLLEHLHSELARGRAALAYLSRNSRAFEAWLLIVALGSLTRMLADAGLVRFGVGGRIDRSQIGHFPRALTAKRTMVAELGAAIADFDNSMAEIDRLLVRTSR